MTKHTIDVHAKRWFQKSYGNTYHSVRIHVDLELLAEVPFAYGYDDAYLQTALAILIDRGILPDATKQDHLRIAAEKAGYELIYSAVDVPRKRDL
jgi:hypothetical protein